MQRTTQTTATTTRWFLAEIVIGLAIVGWESGHRVYVRLNGDGRVEVRGKGGRRATVTMDEACRRLRTVRDRSGQQIAVAQQDRWSEEWAERAAA